MHSQGLHGTLVLGSEGQDRLKVGVEKSPVVGVLAHEGPLPTQE